ncbi:MAG: hypothetical protein ACE5KX_02540 [Acidimicrobiia bacterium]
MSAVAIGALFFAVLLVIVAAMVWQEARKGPRAEPALYVLEEAADFAYDRISDDAISRLDLDDVRRILEWEVHFLQRAARGGGEHSPAPVAGSDEAMRYIQERSAQVQGLAYDIRDIEEVLALEAEYLVEIGAVGPPVGEEP